MFSVILIRNKIRLKMWKYGSSLQSKIADKFLESNLVYLSKYVCIYNLINLSRHLLSLQINSQFSSTKLNIYKYYTLWTLENRVPIKNWIKLVINKKKKNCDSFHVRMPLKTEIDISSPFWKSIPPSNETRINFILKFDRHHYKGIF